MLTALIARTIPLLTSLKIALKAGLVSCSMDRRALEVRLLAMSVRGRTILPHPSLVSSCRNASCQGRSHGSKHQLVFASEREQDHEQGAIRGVIVCCAPCSSLILLSGQYVGESERLVAMLFRVARENAPTVIFLDEVDCLAGQRSESTLPLAVAPAAADVREEGGGTWCLCGWSGVKSSPVLFILFLVFSRRP